MRLQRPVKPAFIPWSPTLYRLTWVLKIDLQMPCRFVLVGNETRSNNDSKVVLIDIFREDREFGMASTKKHRQILIVTRTITKFHYNVGPHLSLFLLSLSSADLGNPLLRQLLPPYNTEFSMVFCGLLLYFFACGIGYRRCRNRISMRKL
jgi:hypothetical protein